MYIAAFNEMHVWKLRLLSGKHGHCLDNKMIKQPVKGLGGVSAVYSKLHFCLTFVSMINFCNSNKNYDHKRMICT